MDVNLGMNGEEMESLIMWNEGTASYVHGVGLNVTRMQSPKRSQVELHRYSRWLYRGAGGYVYL